MTLMTRTVAFIWLGIQGNVNRATMVRAMLQPSGGFCGPIVFALVFAGVAFMKRTNITSSRAYQCITRIYRIGKVKCSIILFSWQVRPESRQFMLRNRRVLSLTPRIVLVGRSSRSSHPLSIIMNASDSLDDSGGYPSSAATFAAGLGVSNFDLEKCVPVACLAPATDFYDHLLFSALAPLVAVALLWIPSIKERITRSSSSRTVQRSVIRWSIFLLELFVSSVSTSVVETLCDKFDDGLFLRAELVLKCGGLAERKLYLDDAWFALLTYPVGEPLHIFDLFLRGHVAYSSPHLHVSTAGDPLLVFVIMFTNREEIQSLGDAMAEHDAGHGTFTFVRDHATMAAADAEASTTSKSVGKQRRPSMIARFVDLLWLSSKIDTFQSRSWWAGSFLIALRIMRTSIMVFIVNPGLRATAASLVALAGIAVQTHFVPYCRTSDNHAALAAAWLLFICRSCYSCGTLGRSTERTW